MLPNHTTLPGWLCQCVPFFNRCIVQNVHLSHEHRQALKCVGQDGHTIKQALSLALAAALCKNVYPLITQLPSSIFQGPERICLKFCAQPATTCAKQFLSK